MISLRHLLDQRGRVWPTAPNASRQAHGDPGARRVDGFRGPSTRGGHCSTVCGDRCSRCGTRLRHTTPYVALAEALELSAGHRDQRLARAARRTRGSRGGLAGSHRRAGSPAPRRIVPAAGRPRGEASSISGWVTQPRRCRPRCRRLAGTRPAPPRGWSMLPRCRRTQRCRAPRAAAHSRGSASCVSSRSS